MHDGPWQSLANNEKNHLEKCTKEKKLKFRKVFMGCSSLSVIAFMCACMHGMCGLQINVREEEKETSCRCHHLKTGPTLCICDTLVYTKQVSIHMCASPL